ncbi:hypothetical protein GQX74_015337 [Glossina fuscipes]|nr:hypothetical protein GQX74_015337 [Glossina fuscipes]
MAGLEAIEPPTINISISGKSSSASGCSSFQKPIVSHPPGEPYGPSFRLKRFIKVGSAKSSKCKEVIFVPGPLPITLVTAGKCATMGISIIKRSGPPASNNKTFHLGFSERRAAKVQPAVPAPTIMKSYSPSILITSLTLNFQKRAPIQYKRNHSDSLGILDVFTASGSILLHCPIYWLWKMRSEAVCCFSNTFGRVFTHSEAIKALTSSLALKHLTECLRSLTNHSQALVQELNLNFSKFSRLQEYVYRFLILSIYYDLVYM